MRYSGTKADLQYKPILSCVPESRSGNRTHGKFVSLTRTTQNLCLVLHLPPLRRFPATFCSQWGGSKTTEEGKRTGHQYNSGDKVKGMKEQLEVRVRYLRVVFCLLNGVLEK